MKKISIFFINFYQKRISPLLGHNCKYNPSCSEYAKQAIKKYGFFKGTLISLQRNLKCKQYYYIEKDPSI